MKKLALISTAAIAALSLGACASPWEGSQLDEQGWYACQSFAIKVKESGGSQVFYRLEPIQRAAFVSAVAGPAGRSATQDIKDAGVLLDRTIDGSRAAWEMAGDTFFGRCLQRGFK